MAKSARDIFCGYITKELGVPHETISSFDNYHDLLLKWQRQINLVADTNDIWSRHFLDSAQMAKLIPNKNSSIVDLGSGAGFPPVILSILGYPYIDAVESDTKKCTFLKEAVRVSNSRMAVSNSRIEHHKREVADFVTSRACADLSALLHYAFSFVSHGTTCLFLKGKKYAMELEEAKLQWLFDYEVTQSITSNEGVILSITNLRRRADHEKNKPNSSKKQHT